jgi:hypothetical protein
LNHIDVVIPTRGRIKKLERTLATIPGTVRGIPVVIHVVCDGDKETEKWCIECDRDLAVYFLPGHNGAVKCRNHVIRGCTGAVLYATDDIEFNPGAIGWAWASLNEHFPDGDGVIGFHQEGNKYHPTGVALVGQKFLLRYPNKELFNPQYFHFACQEIYWLADKLNRFKTEMKAAIYHWHPATHKDEPRAEVDQAHIDARIHKQRDMNLIKARQAAGETWGQ